MNIFDDALSTELKNDLSSTADGDLSGLLGNSILVLRDANPKPSMYTVPSLGILLGGIMNYNQRVNPEAKDIPCMLDILISNESRAPSYKLDKTTGWANVKYSFRSIAITVSALKSLFDINRAMGRVVRIVIVQGNDKFPVLDAYKTLNRIAKDNGVVVVYNLDDDQSEEQGNSLQQKDELISSMDSVIVIKQ